jgi:hypothetical protein
LPIISDAKQKRLSYFSQNNNNNNEDINGDGGSGEGGQNPENKTAKLDPDIKKIKQLRNVLNVIEWVENPDMKSNDNWEMQSNQIGAVSFSLPCAAVYERTIKNEVNRLQIEAFNKKILDMYDDPNLAYSLYENEINKLKKPQSFSK